MVRPGYTSDNACASLTSFHEFGAGYTGIGAFVEAFGDDVYEQDPLCPVTGPYSAFGYAALPFPGDAGVYADVGGTDTYPVLPIPPAVLFGSFPGPADDSGWRHGAGLTLGLDLLSVL